MPFALLFIGILLVVVAVRNMQAPFLALLGGDFSGQGNFFYWIVALILVGVIGYLPKAKPVSDGLLVLILLALVLATGKPGAARGGLFKELTTALSSANNPSSGAITGGTASNLGSAIGNVLGSQLS